MFSMSVKGLAGFNKNLLTLVVAGPVVVGKAIYQEAEAIMTNSKENFVPVNFGVLRSSGVVLPPSVSGTSVSVEMGFGGEAESYAMIVHENLNAHHKVGSAKYLEIPLNNASQGMLGRIAARTKLP